MYGTGGLAYGKVDLASIFSLQICLMPPESSVKTGWVAGGGIELMLQPNVTLNLGYQYLDLGSLSVASRPAAIQCCSNFLTQDASTRARFQTVTLGLSWKFASADPAGASKPWEGGYLGGQFGGGWGVDRLANYFAFFFSSCFTAETQVLMADGTSRPIAAVKIGDEVLGENGAVNRVGAIQIRVLGFAQALRIQRRSGLCDAGTPVHDARRLEIDGAGGDVCREQNVGWRAQGSR